MMRGAIRPSLQARPSTRTHSHFRNTAHFLGPANGMTHGSKTMSAIGRVRKKGAERLVVLGDFFYAKTGRNKATFGAIAA